MLLVKLLDGITSIIVFIAKALLFLLNVLGLWIPALYSLLFVLLCAVFKVEFSQVLGIYLVGLAISVIATLYVIVLRVMHLKNRRIKKREEKRAMGKIRKNTQIDDENESENNDIQSPAQSDFSTSQQNAFKAENQNFQPQTYQPYNNPAQPTIQNGDSSMQSYIPPQTNSQPPQYVSPKETTDGRVMTSSKPIVFKTRLDPNLLIYEYSDRLVFYKKTLNGLEHVKTERKEPLR